ncbi:hypothetical protein [Streptomyces sp. CC208A]|uniref:hypothetical protein n=1 Tax=Streptomyces sp. CC208A TaxID=3044573 RepID=UPI0024A8A95F|nr:hypothetical protein [Streptomyces sp. CC208A]
MSSLEVQHGGRPVPIDTTDSVGGREPHGAAPQRAIRKFRYPTAPLKEPSGDDRALNRGLRALRPPRAEILVDRVHLVAQYQDVGLGYYTWTITEEFRLAA